MQTPWSTPGEFELTEAPRASDARSLSHCLWQGSRAHHISPDTVTPNPCRPRNIGAIPERAARSTVLESVRAIRAANPPELAGAPPRAPGRAAARNARGAGSAKRPAPSVSGRAKQRGEKSRVAAATTTIPFTIAGPALIPTPT